MTKKALFVCGVAERYKLTYAIARDAEERYGVRPYFLTVNANMIRYLKERKVAEDRVLYLKPEISRRIENGRPADEERLRSLEKAYGIPNLMLFWEGMRVHEGYEFEDALKRMEVVFSVTEAAFKKHNFDFAFMDTIAANMQMMFLLTLFEKSGKPFYYVFPSKVPGRFVISRGLDDRHLRVEEAFRELKERDLTDSEDRLAEDFLNAFRGAKDVLERASDKKIKKRRLSDPGRIKRGLYSIWESYRYKTYKGGIRQHSFLGPLQYIFSRAFSDVRTQLYKKHPMFETPDLDRKYMVFFLHKQPEASTFVKAPFHLNQHTIIENIAKSLPVGVLLYVKPHYNDFGGKSLGYYKQILCRPNVRLTKVDANGKELVRRSLGVVTITGTVGWEGLMLGKPVISMGNMFYNMFDQVMKVTDPTRLPEKLSYALEHYRPDETLLKKFVVAVSKGSHPGTIMPPSLSTKVLENENIRNIVDGMAAEGIWGNAVD